MGAPSRREHLARWSQLHGGVAPTGLVALWVSLARWLALPLARAGVAPSAVTLAGGGLAVAAAVAAACGVATGVVVALAVAAVLCDGLDGAVALLRDRVSEAGARLDGAVDRVSDAALLVALTAPWPALAAAVIGVALLEGLRVRRRGAGLGVGLITPGERPVRVVVAVLGLATGLGAGAAWLTAGLCAVGAVQLWLRRDR